MIKPSILAFSAMLIAGCDSALDLRNSPAQQVEDYATCKAGGMTAYQTMYGEVMCRPPVEGENP
jgi:hypothetical protein